MDYYTKKTKVLKEVERLIEGMSGEITREDIYFEITKRFGFGKKVIDDHINGLIERKFLFTFGDYLFSTKVEKEKEKNAPGKQKKGYEEKKKEKTEKLKKNLRYSPKKTKK